MRQEEAALSCCLVIDCSPEGRLMPGSLNVTAPTSLPPSTLLLVHCADHLPRPETLALFLALARQKYDSALNCAFMCPQYRSICISDDQAQNRNRHCGGEGTKSRTADCTVGDTSIMTNVMRRGESEMETALLMYMWQLRSLMK